MLLDLDWRKITLLLQSYNVLIALALALLVNIYFLKTKV